MENDRAKFKNEFKQRLYAWTLRMIKFVDKLPKDSVCNVMGKQLLRSGTSVLANYIEANSASSKKDFINFFTHSLKSANESKVWLTLLRDTDKGEFQELKWLLDELIQIAKSKRRVAKGCEIGKNRDGVTDMIRSNYENCQYCFI